MDRFTRKPDRGQGGNKVITVRCAELSADLAYQSLYTPHIALFNTHYL